MVQSVYDSETIYVQKGLGFIRIAMHSGTPIVPCYSFGENQIFAGRRARCREEPMAGRR